MDGLHTGRRVVSDRSERQMNQHLCSAELCGHHTQHICRSDEPTLGEWQNLTWPETPRDTHGLTVVKARHVAVFLRTTRPRRALPFTMQYGTPILRQSAGRNSTICRERVIYTALRNNEFRVTNLDVGVSDSQRNGCGFQRNDVSQA